MYYKHLFFLLLCMFAFAMPAQAGYYLTIEAQIGEIIADQDGSFTIKAVGGQPNRVGHGQCQGQYIRFDYALFANDGAVNRAYSLAMFARMSGKKVIIYGSAPDCGAADRILVLTY